MKLHLNCFVDSQLAKILNKESDLFVFILSNKNENILSFISTEEELSRIIQAIFTFINETYKGEDIALIISDNSLKKSEIVDGFYDFFANHIVNYEYDQNIKRLALAKDNFILVVLGFDFSTYLKPRYIFEIPIFFSLYFIILILNTKNLKEEL
jgi:hypothetical protein